MNNTGLQQSSGLVILTLEVHSGEKLLHRAMHTMRTSVLHSGEKCIGAYGNAHWWTVLVHRFVHIDAQSDAAYGNAFLFLSAAAAAASGGSGTQWMH